MIRGLILIAALSASAIGRAGDLTLTSGPSKTHLLELYTSEGCSSCPPAEAWFSKLTQAPGLWRDFVPLAFHVDYWDRLGWKDPFASRDWTERQYGYSAAWKSSSVYTPAFVLDGQEWRNRRVPSSSDEKTGILRVRIVDDEVTARFESDSGHALKVSLHAARLGFDQSIQVHAGENSGRKLDHDFVVIGLTSVPLVNGEAKTTLPVAHASLKEGRAAIAAWVTETGKREPLQAVGGWIR